MVRQHIEGRAPELALVNQSGQPLTLTELRGKVVLLTFTYSTCAEVCPLITAAMAALATGSDNVVGTYAFQSLFFVGLLLFVLTLLLNVLGDAFVRRTRQRY